MKNVKKTSTPTIARNSPKRMNGRIGIFCLGDAGFFTSGAFCAGECWTGLFSAGLAAIDSIQHDSELLRESSAIFKVENNQLPKTCDRFFSEWKAQKNEIDKLKSEIASLKMNSLADDFIEINGLKVVSEIMGTDIKELQKIATDFTDNGKADVVIMGNNDGKIVGAASQNAIDNGIKINDIIKTAAGVLGGGGGGRLTLAQGAGKNAEKMDEAIKTAVELIKG